MKINIERMRAGLAELRQYVGHKFLGEWVLPNVEVLSGAPADETRRELTYTPTVDPKKIIKVLERYDIQAQFKDFYIGSAVTTYEIEVEVGTRVTALERYADDIARDLGVTSLRIVRVNGKPSTFGLEVENSERFTVHFKDLFRGIPKGYCLPILMGEDTYGQPVYEDLVRLPHMLVAGQTGSGKSVFLNTLGAGLICSKTPREVQFLIIDPKQVEFAAYENLPHLMEPVATTTEDALGLLSLAVEEMEKRSEILRGSKVKKLEDYNSKALPTEKLPYIVFIIDEFADLMMSGEGQRKEVESMIARVAQKARFVGIHMVLATQRPDAKIMTGLIRSNVTARVAFHVVKSAESRIILDEVGAETLTGMGDMLYRDPNARCEQLALRRLQAPWLSDEDVERLLNQ